MTPESLEPKYEPGAESVAATPIVSKGSTEQLKKIFSLNPYLAHWLCLIRIRDHSFIIDH